MKKQAFIIIIFLVMAGAGLLKGQPAPGTLSLDDFIGLVKEYHPVSRQAAPLPMATMEMLCRRIKSASVAWPWFRFSSPPMT